MHRSRSALRRARCCSTMDGDFAALPISAEDSAVAFEPDESIRHKAISLSSSSEKVDYHFYKSVVTKS